MGLLEEWRAAVAAELPVAVELRHRLHADPRRSGDEADTAALVADAIGLGPGEPAARTGRVLLVPGGGGFAVGMRAELDGLPLVERTGVDWASANGVMHACGHDVHLAGLVAAVRAGWTVDLPRPLVVLLQPREEGADSGAADLVSEGFLAGVEAVVAAHLQPQLPAGVVGVTPGPVNASTDEIRIEVTGRGGHSGYPHTVDDSVLALSSIVVALQQIGSRRIDPVHGSACMVSQLYAGTAANVVPNAASAGGTVRTLRPEDRKQAHDAIREIVAHVAAAHGCEGTVRIDLGEPPLVNDSGIAVAASHLLGEMGHPVSVGFQSFGSDDFAYFCEPARGLMMFVGTGDQAGGLHDPTYLPDDRYVGLVADALIAGWLAAADSG